MNELPEGCSMRVFHGRFTESSLKHAAMKAEQERLKRWTVRDIAAVAMPSRALKAMGSKPSTKGGVTTVQIVRPLPDKQVQVVSEGVAYCRATDNYDRRLGRTIALGRALRQVGDAVEVG